MDLGKLKLQLQQAYPGDAEAALADVFIALALLGAEAKITAGIASIEVAVPIARGQAVNLSANKLRLADASLSRAAIGVCITAALLVGQKAKIILLSGYTSGLSGLTADRLVYLGAAGALLFTRPASGFVQSLGYAISATELLVHVTSDLAPSVSASSILSTTVNITLPAAGVLEWTETVAFTGCVSTNKLFVALAPVLDSVENDAEMLSVLSLSALAGAGQATVVISLAVPAAGIITLHLMAV